MYPGAHAETEPDKAAIVMAATGETISYRELDEEANRLSRVFQSAGLQPGDHVAFCLENQPRFLAIAWGAQYAGLIYTAISSRLTAEEAAYIVDDCGARVFITSMHLADLAAELTDTTPRVELRLMINGTVDAYDSYEAAIAAEPATPLDVRVEGTDMLYSSGTTGRPKGVEVPLPSEPVGTPTAVTMLLQALYAVDDHSVYLSPAPLYHAAPLRFCMSAQRLGATVVVMEHFDPETFLALVERHHVTHTQVVPTMFIRMLKLPKEVRSRYDVSSLRVVIHAAAPCPVEVKRQMIEWWGPVLYEYYAGTEGNGFVCCNSEEWLAHPGTVGKTLTGELHICDDDGHELPTGEAGTIYFAGGNRFEYHNDPAKTRGSRHPQHDDWSTLGDVGYVDDEGYLYLTDRKAFMIISGGVNVYPQEAENVLALHPRVLDVAVFGIPDPEMGEQVKAVVQPLDWNDVGQPLEADLLAYCREHLAHYKCPRSIDFERELPRAPTGKLYKRQLRDRYWPGAASQGSGGSVTPAAG